MRGLRVFLILSLLAVTAIGLSQDWPSGVRNHSARPAPPNSYGWLVNAGTITHTIGATIGPYTGLAGKDGWQITSSGWAYFGTNTLTAPAVTFKGTFEDLQFWQVCDPPVSVQGGEGTQVYFNYARWFATSFTPGSSGNPGEGE